VADYITITVYAGLDEASRLAEKIVKEVQVFLAKEYGIPVEIAVIEVPVPGDEAAEAGLPTVLVEDKVVSSGEAPLATDVVDAVFDKIREENNITGVGLPQFGVIGS